MSRKEHGYKDIAAWIRADFRNREDKEEPLPSYEDLARQYNRMTGATIATSKVRVAFDQELHREFVQRKRRWYVRGEDLAQQAVEFLAKRIGYYLADPVGDEFWADCVDGISFFLGGELSPTLLCLFSTATDARGEDDTIRQSPQFVDAGIFSPALAKRKSDLYKDLRKGGFPGVFLDKRPDDVKDTWAVITTSREAAQKAIAHLVDECECQAVLVIAARDDETLFEVMQDRIDGAEAALKQRNRRVRKEIIRRDGGLDMDRETAALIASSQEYDHDAGGRDVIEKRFNWLSQKATEGKVGILCLQDTLCRGALKALKGLISKKPDDSVLDKWAIGENLFVMSFDNTRFCSAFEPEVSSIINPAFVMGYVAASFVQYWLTLPEHLSKDPDEWVGRWARALNGKTRTETSLRGALDSLETLLGNAPGLHLNEDRWFSRLNGIAQWRETNPEAQIRIDKKRRLIYVPHGIAYRTSAPAPLPK